MKKVYLMYPQKTGTIAPEIYGHFTEHIGSVIYDGIWVGSQSEIPNIKGFRKDIIEKLRAIKTPVIRWPGGCFPEAYNWRDGIGENRPTRVSWWTCINGQYETNRVGTHEFMDFCEAVGAAAYFAVNLTSAPPICTRDWMDYCLSPRGTTTLALEREKNGHPEPFNIPYWGVGNENWYDGGNMTAEFYANEFRRFSTVMYNVNHNISLFACGPNETDYAWTDGLLRNLKSSEKEHLNGMSVHYYCRTDGNPLVFNEAEWTQVLKKAAVIEDIIERNWHIVCGYGMEKHAKLIIDEWGCWHPQGFGFSKGEKLYEQPSTMRDAMVTALTLNIFNKHCDKIRMANLAQLTNVLHSLFITAEDKCIITPTYHIFDMYKEHQAADGIAVTVTENAEFEKAITVSASVKDGKTLITVGNLSCTEAAQFLLETVGADMPKTAEGTLLAAEDMCAHNSLKAPEAVVPKSVSVDLSQPITIPKAAVLAIRF